MLLRRFLPAGALILSLGVTLPPARALRALRQQASAPATPGASTIDDQVQVGVTAYNSGMALVRDVRDVALTPGDSELRFEDIAATVNPATVHLRSLSEPSRVAVVEQNYEYDLLEPEKLLRKYVGREVTLIRTSTENGRTREQEVKARAVSRTALKPLQPADARVEACQSRRGQASHRRRLHLRDGIRDRAAQPQGGAGRRVGERAGGWHLGDAAVHARVEEDGGVAGGVPDAGAGGKAKALPYRRKGGASSAPWSFYICSGRRAAGERTVGQGDVEFFE
jgi:hypothetical protein